MVQTYYDNTFSESHEADDDLTRTENNFTVLKSGFSGTTFVDESTNNYDVEPFMRWSDTYNKVPRYVHPDYGESAFSSASEEEFLGMMFGDEKHKIWVYRDDTIDGWVIDDTVKDVICGVAGDGDGYTQSNSVQGTWQVGHINHNHCWLRASGDVYNEVMYDINGDDQSVPIVESDDLSIKIFASDGSWSHGCISFSLDHYTDNSEATQTDDWRPAAAIGTLQYIKHVGYVEP